MKTQEYSELKTPMIDDIVDYRVEYMKYVKHAVITGDQLRGMCPFHEDRNPSFSVNLKTGQWRCFAEGISGNFLDFFSRIHHVSTREAYSRILSEYEGRNIKPKETSDNQKTYTLETYSAEKHLPAEWLRIFCQLTTAKDRNNVNYLRIPYMDREGKERTYRKRYAGKNFRWRFGDTD